MRTRDLVWLLLLLPASIAAHARTDLQRDVEGYASAACLSRQPQPFLRAQGDAWASTIVQRGRGGIAPLRVVADSVAAEVKRAPVATIRDEEHPMQPMAVPVLFCAEIIDRPRVRAAIDLAVGRLGNAYARDVHR